MSTVAELIESTKRHLYTGSTEPRNKLAASVNSVDGLWSFVYELGPIQAGARLSCGLEDVYVWSSTTPTANVERGQYGSNPASHAQSSIVTVAPRFSDNDVFRAINAEIPSLAGQGLYRMRSIDLTYSPTTEGYDVTGATDVLDIYEARWSSPTFNEWPLLTTPTLSRSMPTDTFPSGFALFVNDASVLPGRTVRVRYKSGFGLVSALTDDLLTVAGIPTNMQDILALGAAIRLAAGREVKRNFTESQGDTRRAEEVPPGANLNSTSALRVLKQQRISEELANLQRLYPIRRHRVNAV